MKNQEPKDITFKKVAWTIKNFSTLETYHLYYSEVFTVGGCAWKISFDKGMIFLRIDLEVADVSSLAQGWSIYAEYTFTVVNQASTKNSVKGSELKSKFCNEKIWSLALGFYEELDKIENPYNGYILNDECIVEVEFSKVSSEGYQVIPKDDEHLGQIEKALVPLLEEACLWHPSLMDCMQKRSREFVERACTALGRVLHFLKKWKDMNEKACEELQQLWEELEMSRLDLSWLEPLVKSAINMKGYGEKVEKVKKMKQNLVVLDTEMNMIKEKLASTEQNIEVIKKELVKAIEDFEEKDLDAEIGYEKLSSPCIDI